MGAWSYGCMGAHTHFSLSVCASCEPEASLRGALVYCRPCDATCPQPVRLEGARLRELCALAQSSSPQLHRECAPMVHSARSTPPRPIPGRRGLPVLSPRASARPSPPRRTRTPRRPLTSRPPRGAPRPLRGRIGDRCGVRCPQSRLALALRRLRQELGGQRLRHDQGLRGGRRASML